MTGGLLIRRGEMAAKVEAVEGTAETLTAAEAKLAIMAPAFSPELSNNVRELVRGSLTPLLRVPGTKFGSMTFQVEAKGSGAVGTVPSWDVVLRACGFARSTAQRINIGAVTSGPFKPGELITGGTSGATGTVIGKVATGDASVPYVVVSGAFTSGEVLTGGTSGATATTSSTPAASQGYLWVPASTSVPSATLGFYHDGVSKKLVGCRGTVAFNAENGGLGTFDFTFQGIYGGVLDEALLGPTYETQIPPAFLDVGLAIHDSYAPHFTTLSVDMANDVQIRPTAQNANGGISAKIISRLPVASIDPEMTLVADHDWYGKVNSGSSDFMHAELGQTAGERIVVASPTTQYIDPSEAERIGIQSLGLALALAGESINTGDDEFQLAMI